MTDTGSPFLLPLIVFNCVLSVAHFAMAIAIAAVHVEFPMTVFETQLKDDVLNDFRCIYDHAQRRVRGEPYCTTDNIGRINLTQCDTNILSQPPNVFSSTSGSPALEAYELVRFGESKAATKWIIFSIEAITAIFHIVYAITYAWVRWEAHRGRKRILSRLVAHGGLPSRWTEYAFTASLMSFIIGNTANVFELYSLLGFTLGTFALMYFGIVIEYFAYNGRPETALLFLYIPGMALFALTWLPLVRQLYTDVLKLTCATWETDSPFSCSVPTCFGHETPIGTFIAVLVVLFCLFPLVALAKIYCVGGWASRWTRPSVQVLRGVVGDGPVARLCTRVFVALFHAVMYSIFVGAGALIAMKRLVFDILWTIVPVDELLEVRGAGGDENTSVREHSFYIGEVFYAVCSATSKLCLAFYFITAFAQRAW